MNLIPLHDFIIAEVMNPKEETTSSGLVIPANVELTAFKLPTGMIVKTGPDVPPKLAAGMKVLYSNHAGWKHSHQGKLYVILQPRDIMVIVD